MKSKYFLALLGLMLFTGSKLESKIGEKQLQHVKRTDLSLRLRYLAFTEPDKVAKQFKWQPMTDLTVTTGGSVEFHFKANGAMEMVGGRGAMNIDKFTKFQLSEKQSAKIPKKLFNGKFNLIGVYEQNTDKNSGYYFVYYVYDSYLLVQLHETIGFVADVMCYSSNGKNPFQAARFNFIYQDKITFKN